MRSYHSPGLLLTPTHSYHSPGLLLTPTHSYHSPVDLPGLPPAREKAFIENINVHACEGVIISWATPEQLASRRTHAIADDHILNPHTPTYIRQTFELLGFRKDAQLTDMLKHYGVSQMTTPWLKGTLQVFRRLRRMQPVVLRSNESVSFLGEYGQPFTQCMSLAYD